jgi:hypothetical protein
MDTNEADTVPKAFQDAADEAAERIWERYSEEEHLAALSNECARFAEAMLGAVQIISRRLTVPVFEYWAQQEQVDKTPVDELTASDLVRASEAEYVLLSPLAQIC